MSGKHLEPPYAGNATKGDPTPDCESPIGYAHPPVATRFKPGRSGNPKGRRKGAKNIGTIIEEALTTKVTIEENGRSRTITAQEVIIRNLVSAAARRDVRAIHALYALKERYRDSLDTTLDPAELQPEDRQIIEAYLSTLSADQNRPTSQLLAQPRDLTTEQADQSGDNLNADEGAA